MLYCKPQKNRLLELLCQGIMQRKHIPGAGTEYVTLLEDLYTLHVQWLLAPFPVWGVCRALEYKVGYILISFWTSRVIGLQKCRVEAARGKSSSFYLGSGACFLKNPSAPTCWVRQVACEIVFSTCHRLTVAHQHPIWKMHITPSVWWESPRRWRTSLHLIDASMQQQLLFWGW